MTAFRSSRFKQESYSELYFLKLYLTGEQNDTRTMRV